MNRVARVWLLYALCVALAGAALAGVTWSALEAERVGLETQRRAELEGAARVALYRMDSQLASLIGTEAGRPVSDYLRAQPGQSAYNRRLVKLYFEMRDKNSLALDEASVGLLGDFAQRIDYGGLRTAVLRAESNLAGQATTLPAMPLAGPIQNEWQNRAQSNALLLQNNVSQLVQESPRSRPGLLAPVWYGGMLFLTRRVEIESEERLQGCWLDWDFLRDALERSVSDLLPQAQLIQAGLSKTQQVSDERRLASLPVFLEPGLLPADSRHEPGPLRMTLLIAWICGALAAASIGGLLGAALSLSERRATFVSAVTHEMRTPLTTFRLYADLLAEGNITDDTKRQRYYETLRAEAARLGHLVENVLAYARIERRKSPRVLDSICINDALDHLMESLEQRAAQSGREVKLEDNDDALSTCIHIDVAAFERILMNLVDNACKHGTPARDPLIRIGVTREGHSICIRVADTGPGVPPDVAHHLFRAFGRSAHEAAGAAPGIGLGLALSRRLAREMRGDLRLEKAGPEGASFALSIPCK